MTDKMNTIYGLFIKYLILTTIYLVLLIIFGEYYFFSRFNIEILNFDGFAELILSQRGLSYWEESAFLIFLPFLITIGFIVHFWIYDTSTLRRTRNFAFVIGLLPFAFLPLLVNIQNLSFSLLLLVISVILLLSLWIILFHVRMFQFSYLSFHLFIACCVILTFTFVSRVDLKVQDCLNSTKIIGTIKDLNVTPIDRDAIFIGNTTSFELYYSPGQRKSIILPKTD
jgi:hypothetical protein